MTANKTEALATTRILKGRSAVFSVTPEKFDSLTGVRFAPLDPSALPYAYRSARNRQEITGDLLLSKTWSRVDQSMKERGIKNFDIAIIRPEGPLQSASSELSESAVRMNTMSGILISILQRTWARLSPNEGVLLIQLPASMKWDRPIPRWMKKLSEGKYDFSYHQYRALKIIKHPDSPDTLPRLSQGDLDSPVTGEDIRLFDSLMQE